jgi:hypothetical protein
MIEEEYRGWLYRIAPRTPCPGIGWTIYARRDATYGVMHMRVPYLSHGAYYDGCDDHPEGAYAWAETDVKHFIEVKL